MEMSKMNRVSLVMPIFKNEENLAKLKIVVTQALRNFEAIGVEMEPIFVIDGSPDNSLEILVNLKQCGELPSTSIILQLSRNFGQIYALLAGIARAGGDAIICYSADMQDPDSLFLPMFSEYQNGNEVVICRRDEREDHWFRSLTSKIAYGFLRRSYPTIPKGGFDFFLIGDKAKSALLSISGGRRFLQGDLLSLGFKTKQIGYKRVERIHGVSAYTFRTRLELFSDAFFDISALPVKVATRLGFLIAMLGFCTATYFVFSYFLGRIPFNGFTAIMTSVLVLGGIQLTLIGLIGEYVHRSHEILRHRPIYLVEKEY
jgi:dolichol-phosphate mannosyltransferase